MPRIDLDRERIEQLVIKAVNDCEHDRDTEFANSFEKWLYYTIAIEVAKLRNQLLQEQIEELKKLIL